MKTEMVMLAVPAETLLEAGIFEGDPLQMYVEGRRLIMAIHDLVDENVLKLPEDPSKSSLGMHIILK